MGYNLLIEIRKDNFFKNRKYSIELDGIDQGILTPVNSRKFLSLEVGKHRVTIQCEDYLIEKEIIVKTTNKFKRFYIKPTISSEIIRGISIGIWLATVAFILYSFFVWNTKITLPLVIVLLFPILFSKRNENNANFVIQE
jgi:hypothetical protein